jgi:heme exporter protein C
VTPQGFAVIVSVVAALVWLIWLALDIGERIATTRWPGWIAIALIPVWLWLVAYYAPLEEAQGIFQKIFYVHIPAIIPMYFGFILTAIGGVLYLRTREDRWDQLAVAGAEVGVLFCSLMLIVGPIWAKPVWGHWWVWDLRLTTTLMLWFIYVAYLFLRSFAFGSDTAKTYTAVYGIVGTAAIPFVYYAVDLAQGSTMHPSNPTREGLPPEMGRTVSVGMVTFIWIFAWLVAKRLELAALHAHALVASRARSA